MTKVLRRAGPPGLATVLLVLPLGDASVMLALAAAVDALALLAVRRRRLVAPARDSVVMPIGKDGGSVYLRRRTVPQLRMHRPLPVIEAQTRWRRAAEARRYTNRVVASLPGFD